MPASSAEADRRIAELWSQPAPAMPAGTPGGDDAIGQLFGPWPDDAAATGQRHSRRSGRVRSPSRRPHCLRRAFTRSRIRVVRAPFGRWLGGAAVIAAAALTAGLSLGTPAGSRSQTEARPADQEVMPTPSEIAAAASAHVDDRAGSAARATQHRRRRARGRGSARTGSVSRRAVGRTGLGHQARQVPPTARAAAIRRPIPTGPGCDEFPPC